jgi:hypothetical protein
MTNHTIQMYYKSLQHYACKLKKKSLLDEHNMLLKNIFPQLTQYVIIIFVNSQCHVNINQL